MGAGRDGGRGPWQVRRRRLLSAATGLAAGVAGCTTDDTPTPSPSDRPVDFTERPIEVLHGWTGPDGSTAIGSVERMFTARHPNVGLDLRPVGGTGNENLNSAIDRRLAGGNPPSSFATWPGPTLDQYEGQLLAIDDVWRANGFVENTHERAVANCQRDGSFLAVPIGSHRVNNLYYNTTLLDRADVDPATLTSLPAYLGLDE
jgi:glucose/mannose transport system substrate-binding protein